MLTVWEIKSQVPKNSGNIRQQDPLFLNYFTNILFFFLPQEYIIGSLLPYTNRWKNENKNKESFPYSDSFMPNLRSTL